MEEIEVKILEINKNEIIQKLINLGAKKIFEGPIKTIYLDSANKLKNKMLRIRQKGNKNIITLKINKKYSEAKINEEYETEIKDLNETKKIFQNLGYIETGIDFRKRISYKIMNSFVEIDLYEDIPPFLEIESPNLNELKEIVKLLGFTLKQTKTWDRKELLNFYRK